MRSQNRSSIHESHNIQNLYKQVTSCLLSCVHLSWLVQSTLVSLVVRDHASTNTPLRQQIPSIFEGWMRYVAPQAHIRNRLSDMELRGRSENLGLVTDSDNLGIWTSGTIRQTWHLRVLLTIDPRLGGYCRIT